MDIICNKCGKTIKQIEYKPFCFVSINQCKCQEGGYELVIPLDEYKENDLKCPECHQYPFKYRPSGVKRFAQVKINSKSPEELIENIL